MALIILIILSLLPLIPLFSPGMFAGHDSQAHIARLVAFYQSLSEGNIIPRWAENLNMGYGHPVLMFLYPLAGYVGSFFHFLGFSFIDSVKLIFGFSYIFSGIFMYLFITELFGKKGGFLAGILYLFAPYRFVDLYVRAALGEHLAFTFMPLVLWSFTKLIKSNYKLYIVHSSLTLALLILSHNAISLMFIPFLGLFLIVMLCHCEPPKAREAILNCIFALILGFSLSAFFWFPAFMEGKYTLRDILTKNEYIERFPSVLSYFYKPAGSPAGEFPKNIGFAHWLLVFAGLVYLIKNKKNKNKWSFWLIFVLEISFWSVFFLLNKISLPVWQSISILQKFQFPWRFLSLTVLLASILAISVKRTTVIILLSVLAIISTLPFWQPNGFIKEDDKYFINVYSGTTDTGESSPIWSIRGMEQKARGHIQLIGGKGQIKELKRNSTQHIYEVKAETDIRLVENTVYFPGWKAVSDGREVPIEFQDQNHRGLITFSIPRGSHQVEVRFEETKLRLFSDYISLVSFIVLFVILIVSMSLRARSDIEGRSNPNKIATSLRSSQ